MVGRTGQIGDGAGSYTHLSRTSVDLSSLRGKQVSADRARRHADRTTPSSNNGVVVDSRSLIEASAKNHRVTEVVSATLLDTRR